MRKPATRHAEPSASTLSPIRNLWICGGIRNDICRRAGLCCHVPAQVQRWHESKDGSHPWHFSNPLGVLRTVDFVATGGRLERYRDPDQLFERGRIFLFREQRKRSSSREVNVSRTFSVEPSSSRG